MGKKGKSENQGQQILCQRMKPGIIESVWDHIDREQNKRSKHLEEKCPSKSLENYPEYCLDKIYCDFFKKAKIWLNNKCRHTKY